KSVVDYIFRWLGIQFLPGYREANSGLLPETMLAAETTPSETVSAEPTAESTGEVKEEKSVIDFDLLERAGVAIKTDQESSVGNRADQFARFQSDAPSCDNCGAITVRNGNCYLCHNCGNSMGCS
ncbi:MAG: vitamin B12-dependent ribonucleotide reductase, partial [Pirellulaceae bacterium]